MEEQIQLKQVKKQYEGSEEPVIENLNLTIRKGSFTILLGPSGCGKSTTLRMIAGLEALSEGELDIEGQDMDGVAPRDRDVAMVFQNYALYPTMNVRDNIEFGLKNAKVPKAEREHRIREVCDMTGLTEYLRRKPGALSGGQRQRVAIGRAIVREPKVLLMDEPLSNLDAKLRNQMRAEIIKLRQRINTTFVYVTHDQTEAMTLGDRIVIMKDGFVQQIGTPQEVFEKPINIFVAGFIGTPQMNFFNARLEKKGGDYSVEYAGASFPLDGEMSAKLAGKGQQSADVILGVRPEHIAVQKDPSASAIEASIEVSELMGSELYLHATVEGGQEVVIRTPTVELPAEYRGGVPYGTKLRFTFSPSLIHLFDPESEKSLLV